MRTKFLGIIAMVVAGSVANAAIVLNQLPATEAGSNTVLASQDFDSTGSFPNRDINIIDDFTVNSSQLNLTLVEAYMGGFGGFTSNASWPLVTGFRVEIYTSVAAGASNLTGNAGSQLVSAASATRVNLGWSNVSLFHNGTESHITLPVNINLPGAGTYWVGVIGVLNEGPSILQVGVANNTGNVGGQNATFINPAGGWGLGTSFPPPGGPEDVAYRLTAVPEPASMLALGLGAAALLARRRRKAA